MIVQFPMDYLMHLVTSIFVQFSKLFLLALIAQRDCSSPRPSRGTLVQNPLQKMMENYFGPLSTWLCLLCFIFARFRSDQICCTVAISRLKVPSHPFQSLINFRSAFRCHVANGIFLILQCLSHRWNVANFSLLCHCFYGKWSD